MAKLQFLPFQSTIEPGFWHWLSKYKLEHLKLSEEPAELRGSFAYDVNDAPRLRLDHCQGSDVTVDRHGKVSVRGTLRLFNTIESFQKRLASYPDEETMGFLRQEAVRYFSVPDAANQSRTPSLFTMFVFADIKRHRFSYQFHFSTLGLPASAMEVERIEKVSGSAKKVAVGIAAREAPLGLVECVVMEGACVRSLPLSAGLEADFDGYFVLPDPSDSDLTPGWNIRNFLSGLALALHGQSRSVNLLCLRGTADVVGDNSYVIRLKISSEDGWKPEDLKCFGWEKGGVRTVDLGAQMDPVLMADSLSSLNLKLMRWQMAPDLNLERITSARCLLLGAGTLGTYVARNLLAWGVRHITFVDSGTVAYSNPVRQSLFEFTDCQGGGRMKAEAAAEALRRILPTVSSAGVVMTIPMPGHGVGGNPEAVKNDVARLEELFEAHDVVFLLLDSREGRWLPTVLGKIKEKIVLNAALGFDSYVAMRHGLKSDLGCYFCTNVSAPGDSTVDRTLDQQCTVTRPGVAVIAAGLVVELMASILDHPMGVDAPAAAEDPADFGPGGDGGPESCLGVVPHSVRGFLRGYFQMTPVTPAFSQCVACSEPVVEAYRERGADLVLEVMDEPLKLEQLTGLDKLQAGCDPSEIWAFSDEESASSLCGVEGANET